MIELTKEFNLVDDSDDNPSSFRACARVTKKEDGVNLTLFRDWNDAEWSFYLDSKELTEFIKLLNTANRTINE